MQQEESGSAISIMEIAVLAYRQRKRLLIALLAPVVLAILVVIFMPPVYRAETDIVVKTGREYLPQSEGEAAMSAPTSTKQEDINSEVELMSSRSMMVEFINTIGLDKLFPDLVSDPPMFGSVMDAAVRAVTVKLSIEPVKLSNIIGVTYDADSPELAAQRLNEFILAYQKEHARVYSTSRGDSYEESMKTALADLDALEQQRTQIKVDNHIFDIAQQRAALITQRVDAEAKLQDSIGSRATLEKRVAYLSETRPKIPGVLPPAAEMVHATGNLTDLEQTEIEMSARLGASNPDLQRVRDQIKGLKGAMGHLQGELSQNTYTPSPLAQQIDQELVMDRAELSPLDDEIKREQDLIATIESELHRLEQADLKLRTISTRVDALNDNLKVLQARVAQARTEEDMDKAKLVSVVQVSKALAPDKPAKPRPLLYTAGGLLVGILISVGMVTFSIVRNNKIVVEQSIERLVGLPVLASVPILPTAPRLIALPRAG